MADRSRYTQMTTNDYRLAIIWISPEGARFFHRSETGFLPGDCAAAWVDRLAGLSESTAFFEAIRNKMSPFSNVVIIGPDMTKFHFRTFLQEQAPDLYRKIIGFETVDRVSPILGTAYLQRYEENLA